jgi:hypothetical protein
LGVVFGSYRRVRPGYSLGSHFCAFLLRCCTNLVRRLGCS